MHDNSWAKWGLPRVNNIYIYICGWKTQINDDKTNSRLNNDSIDENHDEKAK